jgi:hypothetical protein
MSRMDFRVLKIPVPHGLLWDFSTLSVHQRLCIRNTFYIRNFSARKF